MQVVCGVIFHQGKYLIAKRSKGIDEGIWEFPGGKVEKNETKEMAIVRELKEELQIDVQVQEYLMTIEDHHTEEVIYVSAYACEIMNGIPVLQVHDEYQWVKPRELYKYVFQSSDIPLLDLLNRRTLYE